MRKQELKEVPEVLQIASVGVCVCGGGFLFFYFLFLLAVWLHLACGPEACTTAFSLS